MTDSPRQRSQLPTVREVAKHAGVSPMTVSRTLAGGLNVRPELQERVRQAVEALGYHRNETARSLRPGQTSGLVGVAITNLANPYYGEFALGVEEVAAQYGRRIILGNTGEDTGREQQLVSDFIGRQVEGLVVVPSGSRADHLRPERLTGIPVVLASRRVSGLEVDTVLVDDVGGAYRGTQLLVAAGHHDIAYLGTLPSVFTGQRRLRGFKRALNQSGLRLRPELVLRHQQDLASAEEAMRALLDLDQPPTAVFSSNNRNTIGALKEIGRRLRRGDDRASLPAIVSFDNFELSELMPVPVVVIDHDARQLGREAARMLFDRLQSTGAPAPARTIELPVGVVSPAAMS